MQREVDESARGRSSPVVEYVLGGIGALVILALAISAYSALID